MFLSIRKFRSKDEALKIFKNLGNTMEGAEILSSKATTFAVEIQGIDTRAANILKQDSISVCGDCSLPRDASTFKRGTCSVVLLLNLRSGRRLIEKLKLQPFGLKEVAIRLEKLINNYFKNDFSISYKNKRLELNKTTIMGILNVTPDSFSDGGLWNMPDIALKHSEEMVENGAKIIDIGGESTRPGARVVPLDEELKRTMPIIDALGKEFGNDVFLSIDTYKSKVAYEALSHGADIVNDISGLHFDEEMASIVSNWQCPCVISHIKGTPKNMQKNPHYEDVIKEICDYFSETINYAKSKGIKAEKLIIDPGIGFGKRLEDNLCILRRLDTFRIFGLPILIGTSRKSFIGMINKEKDPKKRLEGTLASLYASIVRGARIVRVHDVKEVRRFIEVLESIEDANC